MLTDPPPHPPLLQRVTCTAITMTMNMMDVSFTCDVVDRGDGVRVMREDGGVGGGMGEELRRVTVLGTPAGGWLLPVVWSIEATGEGWWGRVGAWGESDGG